MYDHGIEGRYSGVVCVADDSHSKVGLSNAGESIEDMYLGYSTTEELSQNVQDAAWRARGMETLNL
jgi:hypothetical protein